MPAISSFFGSLRRSYLSDHGEGSDIRFDDSQLFPYFRDAMYAMYASQKNAFYGKKTEADLAALLANGATAEFLATELNDYVQPQYQVELLDRVWRKTSATDQRGQEATNPLARQETADDTPGGGRR